MASLYLYDNKLLFCGTCGTPQQDFGGAFAISAACCCVCPPCSDYPATLYGRFTDKTGDAVDLPDTFELVDVVPPTTTRQWTSDPGDYNMSCHDSGCTIAVTCEPDCTFSVGPAASCGLLNGGAGPGATPMTIVSLSPLYLILEDAVIGPQAPSTCSGTVTIEISEDPF